MPAPLRTLHALFTGGPAEDTHPAPAPAYLAPPTPLYDALADYVAARGGKRVIRKVLIANNGMAATKAIMSMRPRRRRTRARGWCCS